MLDTASIKYLASIDLILVDDVKLPTRRVWIFKILSSCVWTLTDLVKILTHLGRIAITSIRNMAEQVEIPNNCSRILNNSRGGLLGDPHL